MNEVVRPIPNILDRCKEEDIVVRVLNATHMTKHQQNKAYWNYVEKYDEEAQDCIISLCVLMNTNYHELARIAIRLCLAHSMPWDDWDT